MGTSRFLKSMNGNHKVFQTYLLKSRLNGNVKSQFGSMRPRKKRFQNFLIKYSISIIKAPSHVDWIKVIAITQYLIEFQIDPENNYLSTG